MTSMICVECHVSLLAGKIRQIELMHSVKQVFKDRVDPLANNAKLLAELASVEIIRPYHVDRLKQDHLTREARATKLWKLLVRAPETTFFRLVEPLIKRNHAFTFEPLDKEEGRHKMCLRDVVEIVLPLKEMAENYKECLKKEDYCFIVSTEERALRWERLFACLRDISSPDTARIFRNFLNDAQLPELPNVQDLLSGGLPCICKRVNEVSNSKERQLLCHKCKESSGNNVSVVMEVNLKSSASQEIWDLLTNGNYLLNDKSVPLTESMFWYPEIRPPSGNKKDIFCPNDFKDVDDRAKAAPESVRKTFEDLAAYLTEMWTTDLQKVRSIFTWMEAQKIVEQKIDEAAPDTPLFYLKRAAEACGNDGLEDLFVKLCRTACIPCLKVSGKSKAARYQLDDSSTLAYGAQWVIVCIQSNWRFIHLNWALAGVVNFNDGRWTIVEYKGKAVRHSEAACSGTTVARVDEFWFLTDPNIMNIRCHPNDPRMQLLTCPLAFEEFVAIPEFHQDYFATSWKLLRPQSGIVKADGGVCSIDFERPMTPGATRLGYKLFFDEKKSEESLPGELQVDKYVMRAGDSKGTLSLVSRLPVAGIYKLEVTGHDQGGEHSLCVFILSCTSTPSEPRPFPTAPETGFGPGEVSEDAGLSEPSQQDGVILIGRAPSATIDFSFKVRKDVTVRTRLVHPTRLPEELEDYLTVKQADTELNVGVNLPSDDTNPEYSLEFYVTSGTSEREDVEAPDQPDDQENASMDGFFNVLSYLLTCDQKVHEACKNQEKEIHKALEEAMDADEETLQSTLQQFQNNSLYDPVALNRARARQAMYDKIRDDLLAAVRSRSMERIAFTLQQFEQHHLIDDGVIEMAMHRILSLAETGVRDGVARQSLEDIQGALVRAQGNPRFSALVRQAAWFEDGVDACFQLRNLAKTSDVTKAMTLTALLFMTEQTKPNAHLLALLKAVYLLLGEKSKDVSNWKDIQRKLREEKDRSLLKRIQSFKKSRLTGDAVAEASKLLSTVKQEVVAADSVAAKLFAWCHTTIQDFHDKKD